MNLISQEFETSEKKPSIFEPKSEVNEKKLPEHKTEQPKVVLGLCLCHIYVPLIEKSNLKIILNIF